MAQISPQYPQNLASGWALIFSKYLSTYGSSKGLVATSTAIQNTIKKGSFLFKKEITQEGDSNDIRLYGKFSQQKFQIAFKNFEGVTHTLNYVPASSLKRYQSLKNYFESKNLKFKETI